MAMHVSLRVLYPNKPMSDTDLLTGELLQNGKDSVVVADLILQGNCVLLQSLEAACQFFSTIAIRVL